MKRILKFLILILVLTGLVILSWKTSEKRLSEPCSGIKINIDTQENLRFVTRDMILDSLDKKYDDLIGSPLEDINIYLLEEFIESNHNIEKAELYLSINGHLFVEIQQRKPLLRVFEPQQSYYLDDDLLKFSLSDKFSARVKHLYWSEPNLVREKELSKLMMHINEDPFMDAQIIAIEFDEDNEIVLYPRMGQHKIVIGKSTDLKKKITKLKAFYKHGLEEIGWDKYKILNLKYENQVVCTKN